ncbi:MAG: hypothetical protein J6252_06185 [Clostridia bacterium]|nr:hypothetical protein [Clostridia bacterium]
MTVGELASGLSLNILCLPHPERVVTGGFAGDLLSWVMGGAKEGDAWVTIMSNLNVIAVASLCDTACVILASDTVLDEKDLKTAEEKEINVLNSPLPEFELCVKIGELLK